jgi:hypothetical protein
LVEGLKNAQGSRYDSANVTVIGSNVMAVQGDVARAVDLTMKSYPGFKNFSDEKLKAFLSESASGWLSDYKKS